ncbi:YcxB family protein [Aureivirga sp. CE67]|uniref:YcxB family protein n=1 Tax=Aureivirga sp. CE67 TaxID=1788983 RepID=UPI0018CBC888|nr:YcxB family protein [Aureivirga sp. CE67]
MKIEKEHYEGIYLPVTGETHPTEKIIKRDFKIGITLLFLLIVSLPISIYIVDYGITIFVLILFIIALVNYILSKKKFNYSNKKINEWINKQISFEKNEIVLSENTFTIIRGEEETIEKWENIKNIEIKENYFEIEGKHQYVIPKRSLNEKDFEDFKNIIKEKMK